MTRFFFHSAVLALLYLVCATHVYAQTDEIQVYDAEIEKLGQFGITWHNNFTPIGRKIPEIQEGIIPNHTLNGVPEFAYGVADWFELGAYVPVYSLTGTGEFLLDSVKLRTLFVVPNAAERDFFYGVNFEFSYNAAHWEPHQFSAEIRPIIGKRFGPVDIIFNPILDTGFDGVSRLDFAPCIRVAYNVSPTWAVAVEHYADFGEVRHLAAADEQQHALFAVVDYKSKANIEFGVGHGFTAASDDLVIKLMISFDF